MDQSQTYHFQSRVLIPPQAVEVNDMMKVIEDHEEERKHKINIESMMKEYTEAKILELKTEYIDKLNSLQNSNLALQKSLDEKDQHFRQLEHAYGIELKKLHDANLSASINESTSIMMEEYNKLKSVNDVNAAKVDELNKKNHELLSLLKKYGHK